MVLMKTIEYVKRGEYYYLCVNGYCSMNSEIAEGLEVSMEAFNYAITQHAPADGYVAEIYEGNHMPYFRILNEETAQIMVQELKKIAGITKVYQHECTWKMFGTLSVLAESYDESLQKAKEPKMLLPDGEYVNDSFEIEDTEDQHILRCCSCGAEKTEPTHVCMAWCSQCGEEMHFSRLVY